MAGAFKCLAHKKTRLTFSIDFLLFTEYTMHITLACAKTENTREVNKRIQSNRLSKESKTSPTFDISW